METHPILLAIDNPERAAYLAERRAKRLRIFLLGLAVLLTVLLAIGWKVGRHLVAASWLEANHHKVVWETPGKSWKQGGTTSVKYVSHFSMSGSSQRDADLELITWLHRVEELDLSNVPNLTDSDMNFLERLRSLRTLSLDSGRSSGWITKPSLLTDTTLEKIGSLENLETLDMAGHAITDAGLANLSGLRQLKNINVRFTNVTDAGLEHLKNLKQLRSLDLIGTKVTSEGVRKFETQHPDVKVISDTIPVPITNPLDMTLP